jgi:hypothetical protein
MEVSGQIHVPADLPHQGKATGKYWIRDWMGPRNGLDAV